jgi:hypothetical protein
MCRYCFIGTCSWCGASGRVHRDAFWYGGRGWRSETFCHDRRACDLRVARRYGLCRSCHGRLTAESAVFPDGSALCRFCAEAGVEVQA